MKLTIFSSLLLFAELEASSRLLLTISSCKTGECLGVDGITCQNTFRCFANPCTINNGGCASYQQCTANYCGGCNAVCEGDATFISPIASYCGGFENCKTYFDGCNNCFCNEGLEGCTRKHCDEAFLQTPQCLECEFGFAFNDYHECVGKKICENTSDCDKVNSYKCRTDPMCGGTSDIYGELCVDPPNVCVNKSNMCYADEDCDVANGFKCAGFDGQSHLICIKYE